MKDGVVAANGGRESAGPPAAAPRCTVPPGGRVCVLRGFYEGLEIPLDQDRVVIGRGRGADWVLAEPTLSRAHLAIGYQPGEGFFVQDLGSTNGTLLNGTRRERSVLRSGDEIQIGKLLLRVSLPALASQEAVAGEDPVACAG